MGPLISVVIPAYNCGTYLPEAIQSAIDQTYTNVEVIVVNDGSPDDTDEVVQPYLDRIIYVKQENKGLSAARNVGFRISRGEYICFLDADDILLPDKFERQLTVFNRDADLGVVISGFIFVEEDGQTPVQRIEKHWRADGLTRLLKHEVFPPHAALIRRTVLDDSSLFPEEIDTYESQEDWQLWLELALDGVQFSSVPEPTCLYRIRSDSIRANPLKHLDGARRVVRWLCRYPKAHPYQAEIELLGAIVEMERVAAAWRMNRHDLVVENLVSAVRQSPAYWREPLTHMRLFERSLTVQESAAWQKNPQPAWFQDVICKGILGLEPNSFSVMERRSIVAAAYLMLVDLSYGVQDAKMRWLALGQAFRYSARVCIGAPGRTNLLRGILGPQVGGWLASCIHRLQRDNL